MYDVVLRGGRLIDPYQNIDMAADISIADGVIKSIAASLPATDARIYELNGKIVCPGLIDLHTHCYPYATPLGVDPDILAPAAGVLTWVDAGSAGAANIAGFLRHVVDHSPYEILPFINVSFIGLTSVSHLTNHVGELYDLRLADITQMIKAIEAYRPRITGVKLRAGNESVPLAGYEVPFHIARDIADAFALPLMVHLGKGPPLIEDVLPWVKQGDIISHVYTGHSGGIFSPDGRIRPAVVEARQRGVIFDVAHGGGSFSFPVAEKAMDLGFLPDTISSDLHSFNYRTGPVFDLLTTMSKFFLLGLDLKEILAAVTKKPAQALRREGHYQGLAPGAPANLVVLEQQQEEWEAVDAEGNKRTCQTRLRCRLTICRGKIIYQNAVDDSREKV